jgi:cobalt-precorrin 5A hydrolase/precorrin-3B C17-methyltransferase
MAAIKAPRIAIIALGNSSIATAQKIRSLYTFAQVYGSRKRVGNDPDTNGADVLYDDFGATLQALYRDGVAIVALCAAGIVIRALAPLLAQTSAEKTTEPPVLAVAEDGSAVVPLLGGLAGVNVMARAIAAQLQVAPAITTSGELRFGTCLLNPPSGYALADIEHGKRFVSDLLGGQQVRVEGDAHWLRDVALPRDDGAKHVIRVTTQARSHADSDRELRIHPRSIVAFIRQVSADVEADVRAVLAVEAIAPQALACLVALDEHIANAQLARAAAALQVPLRFVSEFDAPVCGSSNHVVLQINDAPVDAETIGRARGALTVVGLGPGAAEFMIPAARTALNAAQDVLGYETYVNMAGPFRADQVLHCTDNREEMVRARHAFELAASGRRVVVVSSGDPGVFAMAAAVLEALHESADAQWHGVDLHIYPGVSAALATAARAGAPLGHDFCVMSLSDNLKPWEVIEKRLDHAAAADFALAFYNPISKARPWQLGRALEIIAQHRSGETVVVLGRDIGRPGETLRTLTLAELRPEYVDMRTMVIIGSSLTQRFVHEDREWVYTPRWYT